MKASPLPTTLPSQPWTRLNQKRFNHPSSAKQSIKQSIRKRPRGSTTPPLISPVLIDEAIVTRTGRTYGAIFSEPIPEPAILVPAASAPVKSWKLWVHGLFTILSLFAVTLGIGPRSYAAGENGAIDFSLPSDFTSADDSSSVPSISNEFLPESTSEPEAAPNISQFPEVTVAENEPPTTDSVTKDAPSSADAEAAPEADPSFPSTPESDSPLSLPPIEPPSPPTESPPTSSANRPPDILNFPPSTPSASAPPAPASPAPSSPAPAQPKSSNDLGDIFKGGSDSLVARTVGHAEGTRTPDGSKTRAYQGHIDPGNGVWNLGSFSFQHCREYNCSTPEEADVHQLKRLRGQADKLRQRTAALGLSMTLLEELNGIDLANQAPLAALGYPGYPEWLKKARDMGLKGEEAVLWARVKSYWDPNLNGWNAPGLGNSEARIEHDQNRRLRAIARALGVYEQQVAAGKIPHARKNQKLALKPQEEQVSDDILFQDSAPGRG